MSMLRGSQEPRIFGVSQLHVCKAVPLHVGRDQPNALVLFCLTVVLKYIYRMEPSSAFVEMPLIYLLSVISFKCLVCQ